MEPARNVASVAETARHVAFRDLSVGDRCVIRVIAARTLGQGRVAVHASAVHPLPVLHPSSLREDKRAVIEKWNGTLATAEKSDTPLTVLLRFIYGKASGPRFQSHFQREPIEHRSRHQHIPLGESRGAVFLSVNFWNQYFHSRKDVAVGGYRKWGKDRSDLRVDVFAAPPITGSIKISGTRRSQEIKNTRRGVQRLTRVLVARQKRFGGEHVRWSRLFYFPFRMHPRMEPGHVPQLLVDALRTAQHTYSFSTPTAVNANPFLALNVEQRTLRGQS
ncbi:hypothetical protein EDD16DRAFT_1525351 [Pisolithus croceorrhizus]|nr:hypothetical protein EDD16DRAFT_1525351 [Pisolithus croceorrhizus]KAI6129066.1 hypothetical protein EV401DRAFT_1884968 [Pisolithus croceorrhizus]KAI6144863.1 hypothetical protein EDD17DRAFT_1901656 [Pisolithus thermaeus]